MLWKKISSSSIPKTKLTRSLCISKQVYCYRGLKVLTSVSAPNVTWGTLHTHILPLTRKCGRRRVMKPEMWLLIQDELRALSRSTISRRCSGKASHYICVVQFATVAWIRICIPPPLFPTCAQTIFSSPVDSRLFILFISAIILLHDPYAHIYSPGCVSAFKILEASRHILDLIYAVCSTSFDVSLLDFFCPVRYLFMKSFPPNH